MLFILSIRNAYGDRAYATVSYTHLDVYKRQAITVEIKEGGISFIRITDNGCGIERDQVAVAFYRLSTSKIRSAEDLLLSLIHI